MTPTEIEGLVSRPCPVCQQPLGSDEVYRAGYDFGNNRTIPPVIGGGQYCIHSKRINMEQAADALSQTIPRTTDEGMREIFIAELEKEGTDGRFWVPSGQTELFDKVCRAALAAMRRVSKTDEGK